MRAHCSHWLFVGSSLIGHWFVVDWPLAWSLTGEARMFQLDEVGNSKKILIKGKSFKRLTYLIVPCFADDWRCFVGAKQTWDVWLPPSVLLSPT